MNIFPGFYRIIPVPTDDSYSPFKCSKCGEIWLGNITQFKKNFMNCPYCGSNDNIDTFYKHAYRNIFEFYNVLALKNLLGLIRIDFDMVDNKIFINNTEADEALLQAYLKLAFEELKRQIDSKNLIVDTEILVNVSDIVNLTEFVNQKMNCCSNIIRVRQDRVKINHCIYCK